MTEKAVLSEQIVIAVNNRAEQANVTIPVWEAGIYRTCDTSMDEIFETNAIGFSTKLQTKEIKAGNLTMELNPFSAVVLHRKEQNTIYD